MRSPLLERDNTLTEGEIRDNKTAIAGLSESPTGGFGLRASLGLTRNERGHQL
jgi:hypothetical protein